LNNIRKEGPFFPGLFFIVLTCTAFLITLSFSGEPLTARYLIYIILCLLMLQAFIGIFLYRKRKRDLREIKEVISKIITNSYKSAEEIHLRGDLSELQKEIKTMFLKTQSDIANLKRLEQIRTEFLGNVSHELRTPIFAIQGFIETLLNGAIDDSSVNRSFLAKANQHTLNLSALLNDLIDISMIESGEMLLSFRYFNAYEFLEEIIQEFIPKAQEKNLSLILLPLDSSLKIYGDKQRLRQVMVNLIMNALKYTDAGSVTIGIADEAERCRIFIRDTGIGIPAEDLKRVFERFYRVDKDRSRMMGGTGLGLAIVKHIVEAHGFKVEVTSEPGKGSEFSFRVKK